MDGRWPSSIHAGVALVLTALVPVGGLTLWQATRTWVPLDTPVLLAQGHFRTPRFHINTESTYKISVVATAASCATLDLVDSLQADWSVSGDGRLVAKGTSEPGYETWGGDRPGKVLGRFDASTGHYTLDVTFRGAASQLDACSPELVVGEAGIAGERNADANWYVGLLFLACFPVGACLVIRAEMLRHSEKLDAQTRTHSLTQPGPQHALAVLVPTRPRYARARHREVRSNTQPFSRTSWFGVIAGVTWLVLFIVIVTLQCWRGGYVPTGMRVRVLRPTVHLPRAPGMQPLLVHVSAGEPPRVSIDSQTTPWPEFDVMLREKLKVRPPDWPVYVEGDADMEWRSVVQVIDRIRGSGGRVVLLPHRR